MAAESKTSSETDHIVDEILQGKRVVPYPPGTVAFLVAQIILTAAVFIMWSAAPNGWLALTRPSVQ